MRILSLLLLTLSLSASAQDVTYLVRDLPGLTIHDSMSFGRMFWTNTSNTTWFTAFTVSGSMEVFKTDGTSSGTVQVTHGSGVPASQNRGPFLGLVNGKLVYGGVDATGPGVFALDTAGGDPILLGRFQLLDLTNGVVRGDTLYFTARPTSSFEREIWRTGGTPDTTAKIDLLPGSQGALDTVRDTHLYSAGPWMFFFGVTPQGGGLHRTDGTAANTLLLLPLTTDALMNDTEATFSLGNQLLFYLRTLQLWVTDGNTGGTLQIGTPSKFSPFGVVGGKLLFDGGGLWATDTTTAGTKRTDVLAAVSTILFTGHVFADRLFLIASPLVGGPLVTNLYETDGTAAATHTILQVNQGNSYGSNEGFGIGNLYYFRHDDGIHGMELWRTDGTSAELVADINPGYRSGVDDATGFQRPDGKVLFAATNYDSGREPWITDGTTSGTQLLKNLATDDPPSASSPNNLRASGDRVFFVANLTGGLGVGVSDGTGAGTTATLVDFASTIFSTAAANGRYFLTASNLFAYDATSAAITPIATTAATPHALPNGVVFVDNAGDLWFSDGTAARKVRSLGPLYAHADLFSVGGAAWISRGSTLWRTDGSDAGTFEINPNPAPTQPSTQDALDFIGSGSWTYFIEASTSDHGYRLWRSDGTANGTTLVKDLGRDGSPAFVGATDRLVYVQMNGKLYRSDGTDAGTIALPVDSPCPGGTVLGDALVFKSYTMIPPINGNITVTVWRSDGTVAGTTALQVFQSAKDGGPGCSPLVTRANAVYFGGWDAAHGWELWRSDGTSAGTRLLADIYPGSKSSLPLELTVAGSHLFFSADSPNIGRELWAVGPQPARHRAVRP